jgi:quercetin dioxygenase-like cupin family protein
MTVTTILRVDLALPPANDHGDDGTGREISAPDRPQMPRGRVLAESDVRGEPATGGGAMISRQKDQIPAATDHVLGGDWSVTPLLSGADGIGFEMGDISIQAGYSTISETGKNPAAFYCLSGEAIFRNLETQSTHYFRAGCLWTIPPNTRFRFTALFPMRLIAIAPAAPADDGCNGKAEPLKFPLPTRS